MTQSTFNSLCQQAGIDPAIALENDAIRQALRARNDAQVRRLLEQEF